MRRSLWPFIGVCLLAVCRNAVSEQAGGGAEQRVPTGEEMAMMVPVAVDEMFEVECEALISMDAQRVWLLWKDLEEVVADRLAESQLAVLVSQLQDGFVSLDSVKEQGLRARFDGAALTVEIGIPAELRRTTSISMVGVSVENDYTVVTEPSDWSGYLNFRLGAERTYPSQGMGSAFQPTLGYQHVTGQRAGVMGGGGVFSGGRGYEWRRQPTRAFYDLPGKRVRYALGEMPVATVGLQDPVMVLGMSVARENSLQPFRRPQPRAGSSLFLEQDSQVEVLVNGQSVRVLSLKAGPYRIQDFQLGAGANEVELVITDRYGVETRKSLDFAFDEQLVAEGETDYAMGVGFRPLDEGFVAGYDWGQPVVSGYFRRGLSSVVTGGGYVQGGRDTAQIGLDGIWAVGGGALRGDVSFSGARESGLGYAFRLSYLRYASSRPARRGKGQWRFDLGHYGRRFRGIDSEEGGRPLLDVRMAHSRRLPWGIGGNFGLGYQHHRSGQGDTFSGRTSFSKRIGSRVSSRLALRASARGDRGFGFDMSFRLEWTFGGSRQHRLSSGFDSRTLSRDLQYSYTPTTTWNQWRGGADWRQHASGDWTTDLRADLSHHRAEFEFGQTIAQQGSALVGSTRFQVSSALAFADGHWGLSRPISDSFALVTGHENLRGRTVDVNWTDGAAETKMDSLGPAVVTSVQSNYPRVVTVHPPDDLPLGYDLGPGEYLVTSGFRGGTLIRIGGELALFGEATVLDESGNPFGLQAGELRALDRPEELAATVFTGRDGRTMFESLYPGRYEIQWFDPSTVPLAFDVPTTDEEAVDLGTLIVRSSDE